MTQDDGTDQFGVQEDGPEEEAAHTRRALEVPPLAAWWVIAAGIVVGLLFVLTDHVLRATAVFGATLLLAAVLRLALSARRAGGLVVRGRILDAATLVALATLVVVSGFTLDMTPR